MIVTYLLADQMVVSIIANFPIVWEENNQLWIEGGSRPLLNDLNKAGWGVYKDKAIEQWDSGGDALILYLYDLGLEDITTEDLPRSEHAGKLIAVNVGNAKPAVVRRWYYGQSYDEDCLVVDNIKEAFQDEKIKVGDWMLVSFLSEMPNSTEIRVAIVTEKIFKSW